MNYVIKEGIPPFDTVEHDTDQVGRHRYNRVHEESGFANAPDEMRDWAAWKCLLLTELACLGRPHKPGCLIRIIPLAV